MDEIELIADDKIVKMEVNLNKWCRVYIIKEGIITKLGAHTLEVILSKLLIAFVNDADRKYVSYKGMEIFTVVCLMEPHAAIVGRDINGSELELLCIEDGGNIIPLVTLSIDDMKNWIKQLVDFMISYNEKIE